MVQYQDLTFEPVYRYLTPLTFVLVNGWVKVIKCLRRGGGSSVFLTITIPLRTSCLLVRFRARDTVWPASADVTLARFLCMLLIEV